MILHAIKYRLDLWATIVSVIAFKISQLNMSSKTNGFISDFLFETGNDCKREQHDHHPHTDTKDGNAQPT